MVKVGINGFGRIGRIAFRVALLKHLEEVKVMAVNTSGSMPASGWAHLVNYDTMYRRFRFEVKAEEVEGQEPLIGYLLVSELGLKVPVLAQPDPAKIPWGEYEAEVIIESTGKFTSEEEAKKHALGGAKRVVIPLRLKGEMSAPMFWVLMNITGRLWFELTLPALPIVSRRWRR